MPFATVTGVRSSCETFARKSALAVVSDSSRSGLSAAWSRALDRRASAARRSAMRRRPGAEGDVAGSTARIARNTASGPSSLERYAGCARLEHLRGGDGGGVGPADDAGLGHDREQPPDELGAGEALGPISATTTPGGCAPRPRPLETRRSRPRSRGRLPDWIRAYWSCARPSGVSHSSTLVGIFPRYRRMPARVDGVGRSAESQAVGRATRPGRCGSRSRRPGRGRWRRASRRSARGASSPCAGRSRGRARPPSWSPRRRPSGGSPSRACDSGGASTRFSAICTSSMNARVSWGWMTALPSSASRAAFTSSSAEASFSR